MIFPFVLKNKEFNIFENERGFDNLTTVYDGREIIVNLEILPSTDLDREKIKISTYDNTNNEYVQNVTYFLSISDTNENLLTEHFFCTRWSFDY